MMIPKPSLSYVIVERLAACSWLLKVSRQFFLQGFDGASVIDKDTGPLQVPFPTQLNDYSHCSAFNFNSSYTLLRTRRTSAINIALSKLRRCCCYNLNRSFTIMKESLQTMLTETVMTLSTLLTVLWNYLYSCLYNL